MLLIWVVIAFYPYEFISRLCITLYCGFVYFHEYQFSWIAENLHFRGYLILWFCWSLYKKYIDLCYSLKIWICGSHVLMKPTKNWYPTKKTESTIVVYIPASVFGGYMYHVNHIFSFLHICQNHLQWQVSHSLLLELLSV